MLIEINIWSVYLLKEYNKSKLAINITNWRRKITSYEYSFLEFLALRNNFFYKLLMKWRKPVFLKEIKMAMITPKDNILLIGGGFLPSESIIITETTNAKVVTIDNNPRACKHANAFLKKRGLSDKIIVKHGDGVNFPVEKFNVVFIAISVWPINSVFKNLTIKLRENARIMCKCYKEDIMNILNHEGIVDSLKLVSKIDNPSSKSYLFVKK